MSMGANDDNLFVCFAPPRDPAQIGLFGGAEEGEP
jgi:hypothetical protein